MLQAGALRLDQTKLNCKLCPLKFARCCSIRAQSEYCTRHLRSAAAYCCLKLLVGELAPSPSVPHHNNPFRGHHADNMLSPIPNCTNDDMTNDIRGSIDDTTTSVHTPNHADANAGGEGLPHQQAHVGKHTTSDVKGHSNASSADRWDGWSLVSYALALVYSGYAIFLAISSNIVM
jgi:hypothetical protein